MLKLSLVRQTRFSVTVTYDYVPVDEVFEHILLFLADCLSHNIRCGAAPEMNPHCPTRNVSKHKLALRQLHIITENVLKVFTDKEKMLEVGGLTKCCKTHMAVDLCGEC